MKALSFDKNGRIFPKEILKSIVEKYRIPVFGINYTVPTVNTNVDLSKIICIADNFSQNENNDLFADINFFNKIPVDSFSFCLSGYGTITANCEIKSFTLSHVSVMLL